MQRFNALSIQLHGNESQGLEMRRRTLAFMRENAQEYRLILPVDDICRRRPKRKNARAATVEVDHSTPESEEQLQKKFDAYMKKMDDPSKFCHELEVLAFARCYGWDVALHRDKDAPYMGGREQTYSAVDGGDPAALPRAVIAHNCGGEHFLSVRSKTGPKEGIPFPLEADKAKAPSPVSPSTRPRSLSPGSYSVKRDEDSDEDTDYAADSSSTAKKVRRQVKQLVSKRKSAGRPLSPARASAPGESRLSSPTRNPAKEHSPPPTDNPDPTEPVTAAPAKSVSPAPAKAQSPAPADATTVKQTSVPPSKAGSPAPATENDVAVAVNSDDDDDEEPVSASAIARRRRSSRRSSRPLSPLPSLSPGPAAKSPSLAPAKGASRSGSPGVTSPARSPPPPPPAKPQGVKKSKGRKKGNGKAKK